ncbi:MAG: hypothetical protein ACFE7R_06275, partial [Candidatus Hodarchaeota archaeon]
SIPANIDRLEMVYRFEVSDEAAILKIDQHIGNFTDPISGEILPEAEGLSLALNYWSSFSSYTISGEFVDGTDVETTASSAEVAPGGILRLVEQEGESVVENRTTVEFGGTYVWGKDGNTYDVGTSIMPMYLYTMAESTDPSQSAADMSQEADTYTFGTYYYSSCYGQWDGYAITHDPIFTVYPKSAPRDVSDFMENLVTASTILGVVGVVIIAVVCTRVNTERKAI